MSINEFLHVTNRIKRYRLSEFESEAIKHDDVKELLSFQKVSKEHQLLSKNVSCSLFNDWMCTQILVGKK